MENKGKGILIFKSWALITTNVNLKDKSFEPTNKMAIKSQKVKSVQILIRLRPIDYRKATNLIIKCYDPNPMVINMPQRIPIFDKSMSSFIPLSN